MTFGTADIVTPMFASTEVVMFFTTSMTAETSFGNLFLRFVLKGNDFGRVGFFNVRPARAMTRFAAGDLVVPTFDLCKLRVRSV